MNADDIAVFLRSNPKFFDQHPELLEKIHVPHPHGGRAIPLSERQTLALREKLKALEARLGELVRFAEENDAISEKVHRLAMVLASARDLAALSQSLDFHLREDFAVPHVALRIWGRDLVDEAQKRAAMVMGGPQCGAAAGNPFASWFGEAAEHVRSMALVPLGEAATFGLLALGSEDAQRFFPDMGTLYLRRIGELCAAAATARL
ncbi:hypothetical protein AYO46_01810 [Betaproteobacteria bacterium SCGC AG-212-J23]|nr:hypothetical protein AYO46_01810 [Betaproteobacteria bacterium SCGC AG-212-J23]